MSGPAIIKLAVLALGGQGGGVLTSWIEALARSAGYAVQATSVAGVAQRTGATIYYVEMCPADPGGRTPVFALAPSAGDVDILIAAELMEAGRAIQRGFVTAQTTLIASTHRAFATSEKVVPGDGRADGSAVMAAAAVSAKDAWMFDYEAAARDGGSVISASLFGALCASGTLPFPRAAFEDTIRKSGRGVEASLRAFGTGARLVAGEGADVEANVIPLRAAARPSGPARQLKRWHALTARIATLPEPARPMALAGLAKVVDFQDHRYGALYLDRLADAAKVDSAAAGWLLTTNAAKFLANAMAYDDVIRVADAKTRAARFARIREEMDVRDGQTMALTEYFHPRAEELVGLLPSPLGQALEGRPGAMAWLGRRFSRGRRVRSASLSGFIPLWLVAGLRPVRRALHRHAVETAHRERWWRLAMDTAAHDVALAAEILACRRLIKGYSDTHARGLSKFDRVLSALPQLHGRADAADWLRRLRQAALADEDGAALDGALKTIASFTKAAA